jgi:hypothetical protein
LCSFLSSCSGNNKYACLISFCCIKILSLKMKYEFLTFTLIPYLSSVTSIINLRHIWHYEIHEHYSTLCTTFLPFTLLFCLSWCFKFPTFIILFQF